MERKFRNQCFTYSFELKIQTIQLYYSGYSRTEIDFSLKSGHGEQRDYNKLKLQ